MPRCHRHRIHNLGNNNRYRSNYFEGYDRRILNKQKSKEILYRQSNLGAHIGLKKQISLNVPSNQKKMNNVELKIVDIKTKIEDEINSRKTAIRKYISKDEECLICQEGTIYQLKREFLVFLLEKSKFGFLKRRKLKKTLKIIRFNLNKALVDILIKHKKNYIICSDSLNSVLKVKSSEWKKWESIIKLIGTNINEYKLSIKEKEIDQLYNEYEAISFPENKEKVKICEKCGLENNRKAIYCYYCGHKF